MNSDIKRHIQDTISILELTPSEANYLETCMTIAYQKGRRDQLMEIYKENKKIMKGKV